MPVPKAAEQGAYVWMMLRDLVGQTDTSVGTLFGVALPENERGSLPLQIIFERAQG
jgi:hypothetical protein